MEEAEAQELQLGHNLGVELSENLTSVESRALSQHGLA